MSFNPGNLSKNQSSIVICHSVSSWLSLTMTWVHNQLRYADQIEHVVLAESVRNLQVFPWQPLYALSNRFNRILLKAARKLGVRLVPHLFQQAVNRHGPSIFHSHFGYQGWYDSPLVQRNKLKHVVTFYGWDVNMLPLQHPVWRSRYRELFQKADRFLCEGPHMASCLAQLGCPLHKIRVQRLGVDLSQIRFQPRTWDKNNSVRILIAGTFKEKKGIPDALEAIAKVRQRYSNIAVTVIGNSTGQSQEEYEKKKILKVVSDNNMSSYVTFLGFQPHEILLREAYKHHIFVSPSITAKSGDTEGGAPVTIIEMAASGMPIVSTNHCDIPEVIRDNVTGLLVDERDVNNLANCIEQLIEHPDLSREFAMAARQHIEENFSAERQGLLLTQQYYELLQ